MASIPAPDPIFRKADKPPAKDVDELLSYARKQLQLGPERPWRLLQSSVKLGKVFIEIEESAPDGPRRIIGKVSKSASAHGAYGILRQLRDAGMRSPSAYCVCEPIAFFPERNLLLQQRAPGTQLLEAVRTQSANPDDIGRAAKWLFALQQVEVAKAPEARPWQIDRLVRELPEALPSVGGRICRAIDFITGRLESRAPEVPSHGDYHLMNIYVDAQCVTAIDLDTFALREPMVDVSYFVAQSAIMGYHTFHSFGPTEAVRRQFIDEYKRLAPKYFDGDRLRVYVALAFLRSLHYDFCILKLNAHEMVEPFLGAAERCVEREGLRLGT